MARVVAFAGTLDLDHVGTQIGQHLGAPGAGENPGQVEYLEMGQGPHAACRVRSHISGP